MPVSIPTSEPLELRAGDTWQWRREDLLDYPAPTWALKYQFKNASGGFLVTASADGANHSITVAASTTTAYNEGRYDYIAWVESGAEKFTVRTGALQVLPDLRANAVANPLDGRSHARRVVEAIEAVIEGRATKDQEAYTIAGRSLQRTPIEQLIMFRDRYRLEVRREEQAQRVAAGLDSGRGVFVRFRRA